MTVSSKGPVEADQEPKVSGCPLLGPSMPTDSITGGTLFLRSELPFPGRKTAPGVGGDFEPARGRPRKMRVCRGKAWESHRRSLELDSLSRTHLSSWVRSLRDSEATRQGQRSHSSRCLST